MFLCQFVQNKIISSPSSSPGRFCTSPKDKSITLRSPSRPSSAYTNEVSIAYYGSPLGSGGFASVTKAFAFDGPYWGKVLAIKEQPATTETRHEAMIMRKLEGNPLEGNPGVLSCYEYYTDEKNRYSAMTLEIGHGTISQDHLINDSGEDFDYSVVRWLFDILQTIHEQGIIHRDIKPENILIIGDGSPENPYRLVYADFGSAEDITNERSEPLLQGTAGYIAPELIPQKRLADPKSDIFSLGVTLLKLATGMDACETVRGFGFDNPGPLFYYMGAGRYAKDYAAFLNTTSDAPKDIKVVQNAEGGYNIAKPNTPDDEVIEATVDFESSSPLVQFIWENMLCPDPDDRKSLVELTRLLDAQFGTDFDSTDRFLPRICEFPIDVQTPHFVSPKKASKSRPRIKRLRTNQRRMDALGLSPRKNKTLQTHRNSRKSSQEFTLRRRLFKTTTSSGLTNDFGGLFNH